MKTSNLEIYVREVKESKKFPYIRYQAYFYIYQNGNRKRIRSNYFTTKTKAKNHAKQLQADYLINGRSETKDATVDDIFNLWIASASLKSGTIKSYKGCYSRYFKGLYRFKKRKNYVAINNYKLSELTSVSIQKFINQVSEYIDYRSTFKIFKAILLNILRTAYMKDYVTTNFCDKLDFPLKSKKKTKRITNPVNFDDCKRYIDYLLEIKKRSFKQSYSVDNQLVMIELLRVTGARISEILSLQWDDLDIHNNELTIMISKNDRSRIVPLSQNMIDFLVNWKREQRKSLLIKGFENINNTILTSIKGKYLTYESSQYRIRKFNELTGIVFHPHQFRHAKATLLLNEMGVGLANVSTALGHADKASTYHYLHEDNSSLREMNERYEELTAELLN